MKTRTQRKFKIEHNIPIPSMYEGRRINGSKYPYMELKVGDSFVVRKTIAQISPYIVQWKRKSKFNFTARTIGKKKVRIWRIK